MKTILVDAIHALVIKGEGVSKPMHELLETYPNRKIIATNASTDQMEALGLADVPYELFTCERDPSKTDPEYYKKMLAHFSLTPEDVICFEHNKEAVRSARSVGIQTYHYDSEAKDLQALKQFLDLHLTS